MKNKLLLHARLFYIYRIPLPTRQTSFHCLTLLIRTKDLCYLKAKQATLIVLLRLFFFTLMKPQHNEKDWLIVWLKSCHCPHTNSRMNSRAIIFSVEVLSSSLPANMSHVFPEFPRTQGAVATLFSNPLLLLLHTGKTNKQTKKLLILNFPNLHEVFWTLCVIFLYYSALLGKKD